MCTFFVRGKRHLVLPPPKKKVEDRKAVQSISSFVQQGLRKKWRKCICGKAEEKDLLGKQISSRSGTESDFFPENRQKSLKWTQYPPALYLRYVREFGCAVLVQYEFYGQKWRKKMIMFRVLNTIFSCRQSVARSRPPKPDTLLRNSQIRLFCRLQKTIVRHRLKKMRWRKICWKRKNKF